MTKGLQNRAGSDPRAASLVALTEVIYKNQDSQAALDKVLSQSQIMPTDKGLCTELFYGTLRYYLRLEWYLGQKLTKPEKLPQELRLVLAQALYELMHTRVPDHAAVNWAVNIVSHRFGQGLGKVANAVLRGAIRAKKTEYLSRAYYAENSGAANPEQGENSAEALALYYAVPLWLAKLWLESYGLEDTLLYLQAGLGFAPQAVRVNVANDEDGAVAGELQAQNASLLAPACWVIKPGSRLPIRTWVAEGKVSRQSAAAYETLFGLSPHGWPQPVWDACVGRGNKTLALLEQNIAVHTVSDPSKKRLQGLEEEIERLGFGDPFKKDCGGNACEVDFDLLMKRKKLPPKPEVTEASATATGFEGLFGTVLVDAPCSGLGTLAHRPEIRWRRSAEDIEKLVATQKEVLRAAHKALKGDSGNSIVYMTCTLNPAENQEQVKSFLAEHPDYTLQKETQSPASSPLAEFFYAAVLVRK
ncbi:hypothetical protein LJB93_01885 [Desulfovibrio sp. OttesenSCG-928-F07]|nr:hypothetical protein [Desulfovibrio sp. OttesenSCG-928-F07]